MNFVRAVSRHVDGLLCKFFRETFKDRPDIKECFEYKQSFRQQETEWNILCDMLHSVHNKFSRSFASSECNYAMSVLRSSSFLVLEGNMFAAIYASYEDRANDKGQETKEKHINARERRRLRTVAFLFGEALGIYKEKIEAIQRDLALLKGFAVIDDDSRKAFPADLEDLIVLKLTSKDSLLKAFKWQVPSPDVETTSVDDKAQIPDPSVYMGSIEEKASAACALLEHVTVLRLLSNRDACRAIFRRPIDQDWDRLNANAHPSELCADPNYCSAMHATATACTDVIKEFKKEDPFNIYDLSLLESTGYCPGEDAELSRVLRRHINVGYLRLDCSYPLNAVFRRTSRKSYGSMRLQ